MFELRLYKDVDEKMYWKETIPSSNLDSLAVMAKIRIKSGEFTHALILDGKGKEVRRLSWESIKGTESDKRLVYREDI